MQSRVRAIVLPSEPTEFREDLRRMLQELERSTGTGVITGECTPPLDVLESDDAIEIAVDLPGVDASSLRIVARGSAILIAGQKLPRRARPDSSFHLVERGYGQFARVVHLAGACDTSRTRATLENGELRVRVPRMTERRGRAIRVDISNVVEPS
jgi:HSP20 family protein